MGAPKLDEEKQRLERAQKEALEAVYFAKARLQMIQAQLNDLEKPTGQIDQRPEPEIT